MVCIAERAEFMKGRKEEHEKRVLGTITANNEHVRSTPLKKAALQRISETAPWHMTSAAEKKGEVKPKATAEEEGTKQKETETEEMKVDEKKGTTMPVTLTQNRWSMRDEGKTHADISNAPWTTKWRRVPSLAASKIIDEGEESKTEKASWQKEGQMACGSKDIPKDKESEAPNNKLENEKDKESRGKRKGQTEQ